jgi:hypothetical protein
MRLLVTSERKKNATKNKQKSFLASRLPLSSGVSA